MLLGEPKAGLQPPCGSDVSSYLWIRMVKRLQLCAVRLLLQLNLRVAVVD